MKFLPLLSSFIKGYELTLMLGIVTLLTLLILGAVLIYSGKSEINRKNIFVFITYRLLQIAFCVEIIIFLAMMLVQIFSIQPNFVVNKKTGASFGMFKPKGYQVPATISYNLLDHLVGTNKEQGSRFSIVTPDKFHTKVYIHSETSWENFIFSLFGYINLISWLFVTFFLLKILSSFRKGNLFGEKHFSYVSYIGITLMLYQVLRFILAFICGQWIIGLGLFIHVSSAMAAHTGSSDFVGGMGFDYHFNFPLFIIGFLIVLLAQVFKKGLDLQKEQELTV